MNKGVVITIIFTVLLLVGGAFMLAKPEEKFDIPARDTSTYEYFWGNGCPHCASVASFLDSWDKKDSISISKYEVWYDKKMHK